MFNSLKNKTDEELYYLLSRDKKAALQAFDEIYNRFSSKVYVYCIKVLYDPDLAEDIFQEVFLKLYESAKPERVMTNLSAFIFKIARNMCLNEKARKHHSFVSVDDLVIPMNDTTNDDKEKSNIINLALDALPKKYKEVLVFKELLGLTYKEIAEILETNLSTVRIRIFRAKEKMRELLTPYLHDLENSN